MQCSRCKLALLPLLASLVAFVAGMISPGTFGRAHAERDSVVVESPAPPGAPTPPTPPSKRIIIGESGVRIEVSDEDTSSFNFDFNVGKSHDADGDDDIVRVGESVYVAPGEVVPGDVVVFGGNAIIEGTVSGSVVVLDGEIRVRNGAEIMGDVVAIGGKIAEDDDVVVRGEKIVVGGIMTHIGDTLDIANGHFRGIMAAFFLFVGLVLFMVTMLFLRDRVERTGEMLSCGVLRSFGAGVLSSIALQFMILVVSIPLIITVIGIPLAAILLLSYVGVFVIASTVFVYAVGRAISARFGFGGGAFGRLAIGFLVLAIPELVAFLFDAVTGGTPSVYVFLKIVSLVVWIFGYIVGLGAIVLSRFGTRPPLGQTAPAGPAPALARQPGA